MLNTAILTDIIISLFAQSYFYLLNHTFRYSIISPGTFIVLESTAAILSLILVCVFVDAISIEIMLADINNNFDTVNNTRIPFPLYKKIFLSTLLALKWNHCSPTFLRS